MKRMTTIKKNNLQLSKRQSGIVLLIALIVLVAMSLAGVALVRSVDTTTLISGNMAFRQGVVQEADRGIEAANAALINTIKSNNISDSPANNYYASRQAGESAKGVPLFLQTKSASLPAGFTEITNTTTQNRIRYVIERLCTGSGVAVLANCVMSNSSGRAADGGTTNDSNLTPPGGPMYRVTVRVDGPKNTVSIVQAMMR